MLLHMFFAPNPRLIYHAVLSVSLYRAPNARLAPVAVLLFVAIFTIIVHVLVVRLLDLIVTAVQNIFDSTSSI